MYGSHQRCVAEESSLYVKLDKFPKIAPKVDQRLRELCDLLSDIESAKQEEYLQGLLYLDSARGVNPIVEKLPQRLQYRWMMEASLYKQEHRLAFPSFSFFSDFLHWEAKVPSFNLHTFPIATNRKDRFPKSHSEHKAEISPFSNFPSSAGDPGKHYPVVRKPHLLQKCNGFREMTLDQLKRTLKAHNICSKCCVSSRHVAGGCCGVTVKFSKCDSDRHRTALRPSLAPWASKSSLPLADRGGDTD